MTSGGRAAWSRKLARWLDEWKIAVRGVVLATANRKFVLVLLVSFVVFGTLMSLLSGSSAALELFWHVDLAGKGKIIWDGFLALFGVGRNFWDFLLTFLVVLLQSVLLGMVALVWRKRQRSKKSQVVATAENSDNLQNAGLAAGLAILGSGCPTCGTTLLMPVIGTLFSTSGYALAGAISGVLTLASVIIALLTLKRISNQAHAMIIAERRLARKAANSNAPAAKTSGPNVQTSKTPGSNRTKVSAKSTNPQTNPKEESNRESN